MGILTLLLALAASALAGPYSGAVISTTTGRQTNNLSGRYHIAASSKAPGAYTITLDGVTGGINASSFTATYGIKAATASFSGGITAQAYNLVSGGQIPALVSTQTWSGGNSLYGSTTFYGPVEFSPSLLKISSTSAMTSTAITQDTIGPCVTGSTLTHVTSSGRVRVVYSGSVTSGSNNLALVSVLIDSGFPPGFSSTTAFRYQVSGAPTNASFNLPIQTTIGAHTYCLAGAFVGGGTIDIPYTTNAYAIFMIEEMP